MRDLAPHNRQLLDFIKLHQPVDMARLFALFDGAGENESAFNKRLHYLKMHDWLTSARSHNRTVWSVNPDVRPMHTGARAGADALQAAPRNVGRAISLRTVQLVDFIHQHQPASTSNLFALFDGAGENESAFTKHLHNIKTRGWLTTARSDNRTVWSVNPEAMRKLLASRAAALTPATPAPPPIVTPPQSTNRMQGFYVPPRAPAGRPGCDDHLSLPSLRGGQRVAFVPGYITH